MTRTTLHEAVMNREGLTAPQRNSLYHVIEDSRLDPVEFEWKPRSADWWVEKLIHLPTGGDFEIWHNVRTRIFLQHARRKRRSRFLAWSLPDRWSFSWEPTIDSPHERSSSQDWPAVVVAFRRWIEALELLSEPDLWAAAKEVSGRDDSYFAPQERAEISHALREIADHLATRLSLSPSGRAELEITFVVPLEEASGKLTRGKWREIFVTALMAELIRLGLEGEPAHSVLRFAGHLLSHLFGAHIPELPPGG